MAYKLQPPHLHKSFYNKEMPLKKYCLKFNTSLSISDLYHYMKLNENQSLSRKCSQIEDGRRINK